MAKNNNQNKKIQISQIVLFILVSTMSSLGPSRGIVEEYPICQESFLGMSGGWTRLDQQINNRILFYLFMSLISKRHCCSVACLKSPPSLPNRPRMPRWAHSVFLLFTLQLTYLGTYWDWKVSIILNIFSVSLKHCTLSNHLKSLNQYLLLNNLFSWLLLILSFYNIWFDIWTYF